MYGTNRPASGVAGRGAGGGGGGRAPSGGGPSFAQIQASYAALMEDDDYIPPTASAPSRAGAGGGGAYGRASVPPPRASVHTRAPSAGRGTGAGRGGAPAARGHQQPMSGGGGAFHFEQPSRGGGGDDPGAYKLDALVRRGSGGGVPSHPQQQQQRRGSATSNNNSISTAGGGLTQWSLPVDTTRSGGGGGGGGRAPSEGGGVGGNGGGGGGGIHSGFFYNDNHDFNSDDDDVNNNALYYGDEQLRTGVTKKGTVAMSPGRIRRTPQSSNEPSPTNVYSMRGAGAGAGVASSARGGGGGLSASHGRGVGGAPHQPAPTDAYKKSVVSAPNSRRNSGSTGRGGGGGGGGGYSTVDVLNNEHRVTAKGRQVREDVDNMMDAYYGNGGVNEYNNLGNMANVGAGRLRSSGGSATLMDDDDASTQQIDARRVGGSSSENRQALANCTAPRSADSPMFKPQTSVARMNPSWRRGPKTEEGRIFDASDRNLLCMDVRGESAVVGSADHGLKVFDIKTMRERRNLYGKKCGHTEWVTSVVYLPDGRILSGGMDSKLCLWHASAVKCDDLLGHTGSISQVDASPQGIAVSASYDRTLRVWSVGGSRPSCLTSLVGHGQPVMSFAWAGPMVMSGDRRGTVKVWDLETSACAATHETKGGQIGALGHLLHPEMGQISAVGDQKGTVTIFDFRRSGASPIFSETLHAGGVVSSIKGMPLASGGGGGLIITAGADRNIRALDPRMNFRPVHTMSDHKDFIYSMETYGDLVVSGGGNGWLLVHDTKTGKCLYGLGANAAAVRCIFPSSEFLVAAGDDGKAMVYDF